MLWHLEPCWLSDWEETWLIFSDRNHSKWLTQETAFHTQTNQPRTHAQNHLLYLAHTLQEAILLCPTHPRARYPTTRDSPIPQSPLKFFKLASPKPAYPACLPCGSHNKGSCCCSPLPFLSPGHPGASRCDPASMAFPHSSWELVVGIRSDGSPLLICQPHHNYNKTYILKPFCLCKLKWIF